MGDFPPIFSYCSSFLLWNRKHEQRWLDEFSFVAFEFKWSVLHWCGKMSAVWLSVLWLWRQFINCMFTTLVSSYNPWWWFIHKILTLTCAYCNTLKKSHSGLLWTPAVQDGRWLLPEYRCYWVLWVKCAEGGHTACEVNGPFNTY